jgi:hypothetical protein
VALAAITTLSLDRLATGRDLATVVRLFSKRAKAALYLKPQDRDVVLQRMRVYAESKAAAR